MSRWTTVRSLLRLDITLQDQLEWAENGLPVYNDKGQRIIERNDLDDPPKGCEFLRSYPGPYHEEWATFYEWNNAHEIYDAFQYKSNELIQYVVKNNLNHLFPDDFLKIIGSTYSQSKAKRNIFLGMSLQECQDKITTMTTRIQDLKRILEAHGIDFTHTVTANAIKARQRKASKDWEMTLERAVSLAVRCAREARPKSIEQHKKMWKAIFDQQNAKLPRKDGFEAFRRGLPDDLKGNG